MSDWDGDGLYSKARTVTAAGRFCFCIIACDSFRMGRMRGFYSYGNVVGLGRVLTHFYSFRNVNYMRAFVSFECDRDGYGYISILSEMLVCGAFFSFRMHRDGYGHFYSFRNVDM